jgi:glycosyltransferase involved in cell wall biosynthesis
LNLLFITHYTGRGGGESVQLNLMSELAPRGYTMHLVTPQLGKFNELAAAYGVQSHVIPFRGVSTWFVPFIYKRLPVVASLTRLVHDLKIDLIHSDYHALPFAVGASERTHVPVLWNAMGGWFAIKRWQHDFFRSQVTRSVAITDTVRRELLDGSWLPLEKMPILIPGVNPDELKPGVVSGAAVREKIGIAPEVPLVSLIGRFQHIKGQHIFLEMAQRILVQRPDVHFALTGDNVFNVAKDEHYKQQIIQTVENDPKLRAQVHFLGFWPDSREVLAASDVIACTSYSESLGMVVIEAMSMGRAVVSTSAGGPSETVIDGKTGFLVEPGDPAAFAEATLKLLNDPALRVQLGTQARAHVIEHLSVRTYADQMERIIQDMVKR